ncbi:hypothetical protein [Marinomonas rhodophyticola]|uniref:hypothetical protein n=1 Tax=Marinomonas rhodophyticola TaxID=2992803 RepID=UPI003D1677EB
MSNMVTSLPYHALSAKVPSDHLNFKTLNDIEPLNGILGQERAVEAIQFGVAMQRPGYNIFAMGDSGTGRSSYVMSYLRSEAKRRRHQMSGPMLTTLQKAIVLKRSSLLLVKRLSLKKRLGL